MRKRSNRRFVSILLISLLIVSPTGIARDVKNQKRKVDQTTTRNNDTKKLTEEQKIVHLLDRVTFGARPGDLERLTKLGWEKYLDEQLHPERISNQAVEQRLQNIES